MKKTRQNKKLGPGFDSIKAGIVLAFIPAVLLAFGLVLRGIVAPVYAGLDLYDYDPAYTYLFNGAGLIEGFTPAHTDHPGTPLQVLCGAVSYLLWMLFRSDVPFGAAVFADPEFFLRVVSIVLLALNAAALWILGWRVHAASRSLSVALLAQSGLLLLGPMMPRLFYVAPEALVLTSASLAMAVLARVLFASETAFDWRRPILLGAVIALGITAKVTFLPLVALILLLPSVREMAIATGALAAFAALFLSPIYSRLGQTYEWLAGILLHQGRYGFGQEGIVDFAKVPGHATELLLAEPILAVAALGCLAVIFSRARAGRARYVAVVLVAILAAQVAMVLKHFELYYALASFGIAATVIAWSASQVLGRRAAAALASLAIVAGAALGAAYAQGLAARAATRDVQLARLDAELARHPDAVVVGVFRARGLNFARQFALAFANHDYAAPLIASDPRWTHYQRWRGFVETAEGERPVAVLADYLARGVTLLALLPRDGEIPGVVEELLLQLDDERLVRVLEIRDTPPD